MRIAVISDTHGKINRCIYAIEKLPHIDAIIHLGDVYDDAEDLSDYFTQTPVYAVGGNCGLSFRAETDRLIELGGLRIFLTHGHMYSVKQSLTALAKKVKEVGADIGMFGHTHLCFDSYVDNVRLINPGSASIPARGECTMGILEIKKEGLPSFTFKEI